MARYPTCLLRDRLDMVRLLEQSSTSHQCTVPAFSVVSWWSSAPHARSLFIAIGKKGCIVTSIRGEYGSEKAGRTVGHFQTGGREPRKNGGSPRWGALEGGEMKVNGSCKDRNL